jgi:hypothetical protein
MRNKGKGKGEYMGKGKDMEKGKGWLPSWSGKGKDDGKGKGNGEYMGKGKDMEKGKGCLPSWSGKGKDDGNDARRWSGKGMGDGSDDEAAPRVRNQATSISGDTLYAMGVKEDCWVEITPSSFRGIEGDRVAPPGLKEC